MSSLTLARNSQVGTLEAGFKVLGQPSVAIEPSESALDNPAPRQDDKAADGIGTLDDLDDPLADFVESGVELGAAVGAVGKDMPQPRMEMSDRGQRCAIAILDVGFGRPNFRGAGSKASISAHSSSVTSLA